MGLLEELKELSQAAIEHKLREEEKRREEWEEESKHIFTEVIKAVPGWARLMAMDGQRSLVIYTLTDRDVRDGLMLCGAGWKIFDWCHEVGLNPKIIEKEIEDTSGGKSVWETIKAIQIRW